MRPQWFPTEVVVATHNPGKLCEWRTLLGALGVAVQSADELSLPEPEETATTYRGNARLKAEAAAMQVGRAAIADDTGFEAHRLGGRPGLSTARWAAARGGYPRALHALVDEAGAGTPASLVCAVAIATPTGVFDAEARIDGTLVETPTDAPGFAAILNPSSTHALMTGGVLAHRRAAFDALISR